MYYIRVMSWLDDIYDTIIGFIDKAQKWYDGLPSWVRMIVGFGKAAVMGALKGQKCDITDLGENCKKLYEATPAICHIFDEFRRAKDEKKFTGEFQEWIDNGYTYNNGAYGGYNYMPPTLRKDNQWAYENMWHMPKDFKYSDIEAAVNEYNEKNPDDKIDLDDIDGSKAKEAIEKAKKNHEAWYNCLTDKQKEQWDHHFPGVDLPPGFPEYDPNHDYVTNPIHCEDSGWQSDEEKDEILKKMQDIKNGLTDSGGILNPSAISETPDLDKYSYGS